MTASPRHALVTGASGYIGRLLVPRLLDHGWAVRVLSRSPDGLDPHWANRVEVCLGDATDDADLARALREVDVAYYLMHAMEGGSGFAERDRQMARTFAQMAERSGVSRVVYLSGLHPPRPTSEHLRSRVEVGQILLDGAVPAIVLQAGVVLGSGSASFEMLRHLSERLPAVVAPKWLRNRIQPIAVDDALHYLAGAAGIEGEPNRSYDIGGPEILTYAEMMKRYAEVAGLGRRMIATVPLLTPGLASHWVGLVTPVSAKTARPLVGSLIHDAVCSEDDVLQAIGPPPTGRTGFDDAVRLAIRDLDTETWRRRGRVIAACALTAVLVPVGIAAIRRYHSG